jgi:cobalt transporter subunit CbtB
MVPQAAVPAAAHPTPTSIAGERAGTLVQASLAVILGLLIVGTVGFSHIEAVHNAAHDTRHSNAFPCH